MRPGRIHLRIWLLACMGCLMLWMTPAQASWEAYQQAGEAASSRGDYRTARRMFLAAVREARHFGPQDPRLDISLNKLALLRTARGAPGKGGGHTQRVAGRKARKTSVARRGRQRPPSRMVLRRAKSGRQQHALLPAHHGERRKGTRTSLARQEHRTKRPRVLLRRARPTRRVVLPVRRGKRLENRRQRSLRREPRFTKPHVALRRPARHGRAAPPVRRSRRYEAIRTPRLQRGPTLQRPRSTLRRAGPQRPGRPPGTARPGLRRKGARSARRAMLLAPYATPALSTTALHPLLATDLVA